MAFSAAGLFFHPSSAQADPEHGPAWHVREANRIRSEKEITALTDKEAQAALSEYEQAYAHQPHYLIRCNIGLLSTRLNRTAEALFALKGCLADGGDRLLETDRRDFELQIEELRIKIDAQRNLPNGTEVLVDEDNKSPIPETRVSGTSSRLDAFPSTKGIQSEALKSGRSGPHMQRTVGWTMVGVGAAAIVASVVTRLMAVQLEDRLDARCANRACGPNEWSDVDRHETLGKVSYISMLAGGVMVGTGVSLVVASPPDRMSSMLKHPATTITFSGRF